jgi:hypothetical protein
MLEKLPAAEKSVQPTVPLRPELASTAEGQLVHFGEGRPVSRRLRLRTAIVSEVIEILG